MKLINLFLITFLTGSISIFAQTSAFTYQGSLNDNSSQANGTYQMRFSLFNALMGGNQIGSSIEIQNVQVANGIFSVDLDFGIAAFNSVRFLQVEVRRSSGENYTALTPRQIINGVPFAFLAEKARDSNQLGGLPPGNFLRNDLNQAIRNLTFMQPDSNFNISGNGTAERFSARDGYFMSSGERILKMTNFNLMVGSGTGDPTGTSNTLVGITAGNALTTGNINTFVGTSAGSRSISGSENTFIGSNAGIENTTGNLNTFIGRRSGVGNRTGSNNTTLGTLADLSDNLNFATAIGAGSFTRTSNTIQIGRREDRTNVSGTLNVLDGLALPIERGTVNFLRSVGNMNLYMQGGGSNTVGVNFGVSSPDNGTSTLFISHYNGTTYQDRIVLNPTGTVDIRVLGAAGSTNLCYNVNQEIAACSSSIRYKSNVENFSNGLEIVKKLRPVSFNWTDGGMLDFGLVAEEVAEVEPLLTTQNEDGKTEGVKYDRVGVVLINAVKQQQKQIEDQQTEIKKQEETIKRQQAEIELLKKQQKEFAALKTLVCSTNREAELCKTENQITAENPESAVKENK